MKKSSVELEIDKIRDASIDAMGKAWLAVRDAESRLKTNAERRMTVSAMRGESHNTVRELADHPIGDEILTYRMIVLCSETVAGVLHKIKTAMAEDSGKHAAKSKVEDDSVPTPPDVFAKYRKR